MTTPVTPDLPTPVDLTLHNVTETQLVDAMISDMQITVPEWEPQEGAVEITLMEAAALTMGQFIFALNQLPRVVLDGLVTLHGLTRNEAVSAIGQVQVTLASTTIGTRELPEGARFRVETDGGVSIDLVTVEPVSMNPTDSLVATVNVMAVEPGSLPNGIPAGTTALMVDTYTWIESAVISSTLGGGGDIESDAKYYARAAAELQGQSSTLVIDQQFSTQALRNDTVGRAKAFGLWDGAGAPGTVRGTSRLPLRRPMAPTSPPTSSQPCWWTSRPTRSRGSRFMSSTSCTS